MTSNRFFIKQKSIHYPNIHLNGEEHHHLSKVARVKPKEEVWLFDEHGLSYLARVENIEKDSTRLYILEKKEKEEPRVRITLGQALIKTKKMELILKKSTELGVMAFIPVVTSRSIVKIEGKIERKIERWRKIAQEASKQCGRSILPEVMPPQFLEKFLNRDSVIKLFLIKRGGKPIKDILLAQQNQDSKSFVSSAIVLTGPEGGWTDEEEEDILKSGYQAVSLGRYTLRAETAAISSLAIISHFWNW